MIRVRFVTGNDWLSNAIRAGERDGWCTHVDAVMPDGSMLGAHIEGGVQIKPAGYDKGTVTRELVVSLLGSDAKFYEFLRAQLGKPYDTTAVLGLGLSAVAPALSYAAVKAASFLGLHHIAHKAREWREPDSWYCSELIAAALEACGYFPRLSSSNNHISPRDLLLVLSGRVALGRPD